MRLARIKHKGDFRMGDGWSPFDSEQHYTSQPPGFVWDASIRTAPLTMVRVRDAYVAGRGLMQAKVFSFVPVVDQCGGAELNAGALQRYLAEAPAFPTALLPSQGIQWSAIDANRALATLTHSGITVSLEFRFNDTGEITSVFSPGRYREVKGKYELTPWRGHWQHYEERGGMRIPMEGKVEWQLPDGHLPYWKGRIVDVDYEFAR